MASRWVDEVGPLSGLRAAEKAVLFCLAYHAAEDGTVRLSVPFMSRWTGLSEGTVWRTLRDLAARGLVTKRTRSGRTTRYRLMGPGVRNVEMGNDISPSPCGPDAIGPTGLSLRGRGGGYTPAPSRG